MELEGEWELESGRLDDHVEQVEHVEERGLGGVEGVQKFQKIGQTIFLESGGLAGRQFAGFDGVDGAAGDEGSGFVEEVGFGFGVGGGEFGGGAREGEEVR